MLAFVEYDDARHRMGLFRDTVKKCHHVLAHGVLFLDRPQQLASMVQRTQDIDTLPMYSGLGTPGLADRGPSILQRRIRAESSLIEIQQIALPRLRHALQRFVLPLRVEQHAALHTIDAAAAVQLRASGS